MLLNVSIKLPYLTSAILSILLSLTDTISTVRSVFGVVANDCFRLFSFSFSLACLSESLKYMLIRTPPIPSPLLSLCYGKATSFNIPKEEYFDHSAYIFVKLGLNDLKYYLLMLSNADGVSITVRYTLESIL